MNTKLKIFGLIIWFLICATVAACGVAIVAQAEELIGGIVVIVIGIVLAVYPFLFSLAVKAYAKKKATATLEPKREIKRVKLLKSDIVHRAEGIAVNFTFLVIYKGFKRETVTCMCGSEKSNELFKYVKEKSPSKPSNPLTIDEMIFFDELEE